MDKRNNPLEDGVYTPIEEAEDRRLKNSDPDNVFKDGRGRWRTMSLFLETSYGKEWTSKSMTPLYTLKDHDYQGLPSLKRLYLESCDLTEYMVATTCLGGWAHWQVLTNLKWFQDYVVLWREELEVKLRSDALRTVATDAVSETKSSVTSAKWIASGEYKEKKRGKPSKAEIDAETRRQSAIDKQLNEHAEAIGLSLVDSE